MKIQVDSPDTGKTLLSCLRDRLTDYPSVKAIKRAIEAKQCTINGQVETFSTHRVKEGDQIAILLPVKKMAFSTDILFEDEELILLNKPPGRTSESFSEYLLVHRLDKDTSGVMVFAKTEKMQRALIGLFREREVEKSYLAICDGKIDEEKWTHEDFLERKVSYQGGCLYGKAPRGKGKIAITHFQLLKSCEVASLVLAKPITGRTHQVRVHLFSKGHPVIGDYQYGKNFKCPLKTTRQMLHSQEIAFVHPFTNAPIHCKAPLLSDFFDAQKTLFGA